MAEPAASNTVERTGGGTRTAVLLEADATVLCEQGMVRQKRLQREMSLGRREMNGNTT